MALIEQKGPSREILIKSLLGKYKLLISNALFLEYEDVSKRKKILDICPLSDKEITKLLNALYSVSDWIRIYYLWRPNIADEGDNFLIEELSTQALAEFDSEVRFRALAANGNIEKGLKSLDKLDASYIALPSPLGIL